MKKRTILLYSLLGLTTLGMFGCGKGFLEKNPQGELIEEQIEGKKGVEATLIGAYAIMNGNISGTWGTMVRRQVNGFSERLHRTMRTKDR
ncbi:hypothetical protein KUH03_10920 [Sphingobacterium sp. E70]|uniref:hypothetical protein n=1 Tax=Sphingobacterium sp. E70 TaxID=2853439 RepID=UPI00211BB090|nr:hypothetical protein [Sphingobacterium sp. E70]ULT27216.1 hypothetical protein KUH03_10920 [Sphingobacterium sp. E70]